MGRWKLGWTCWKSRSKSGVCLPREHLDRDNLLRVRYSPSASELSAVDTTCRLLGQEVHAQANRRDALLLFDNDIGLLESVLQLLATHSKVNRDYKPAIILRQLTRVLGGQHVFICHSVGQDRFFVLRLMVKTVLLRRAFSTSFDLLNASSENGRLKTRWCR